MGVTQGWEEKGAGERAVSTKALGWDWIPLTERKNSEQMWAVPDSSRLWKGPRAAPWGLQGRFGLQSIYVGFHFGGDGLGYGLCDQ